ncbi:MAG: amidohydrolase family protein, partial [Zavarzinia sp.]|nr:amidohydrolase family protein [Zavarzinia sp.]
MDYDLKITGGTIVDGTGKPAYKGDVAVKDGRIVALGACPGAAARVIDAVGAIVTPGFVDLHTHYDGQVSWDPDLRPSVNHGVTTAVLGNCGVGFAPVRPQDHDCLIRLMEGVEDIPGVALAEGLSWNWESFPDYMKAIDFPHTIDFAAMVPHDPLRVYVMGERAIRGEAATAEDVARMRALVREAMEAGAFGFATGRSDTHRTSDGLATPASEATIAELTGIAEAMKGLDHGVLQAVSDFNLEKGPEEFEREFDIVEAYAATAPDHPTSITLMERPLDPGQWRKIVARAEAAREKGITIRMQTAPRAVGVMVGFQCTFHPFMGHPSYKALAHLPLAERVARLRDPAVKARIMSETPDKMAADGSSVPPMVDKFLAAVDFVSTMLFQLGETPDYEQPFEKSMYARSQALGVSPISAIYDAMLEDEGRAMLYFPFSNYVEFSLDNVLSMMRHPLALAGLSDGGAHVGTVCDASFSTFMLSYWARDRAKGERLSVEQVVRMLSGANAEHGGFRDRGTLEVGKRADINVIDFDRLTLKSPHMVHDLPAGGQR